MSHHATIKGSIATLVATTACLALAACATEVSPPAQDVGRTTDRTSGKIAPVPPKVPKPSAELGDDHGRADTGEPAKPRRHQWDPVDRTKDWH